MSIPSRKKEVGRKEQGPLLFATQVLLTLFTGWIAAGTYIATDDSVWQIYAGLCCYSLIATVGRMGWLIPGVVAGALCGIESGLLSHLAGSDERTIEFARHVFSGALMGLFFGSIMDYGFVKDLASSTNDLTITPVPPPSR